MVGSRSIAGQAMKLYYIGAGLFVVGFLIFGVLAASFLNGSATTPDKKPQTAAEGSTGKGAPVKNAGENGVARRRPATGSSASSSPTQMQTASPQGAVNPSGSSGLSASSGSTGSYGSLGPSGSPDSSGSLGSSFGVGLSAPPGTPIGPGTGLPHISTTPPPPGPKVPAMQPAPIAGRGGAVAAPP
jgi:hypothetical protein